MQVDLFFYREPEETKQLEEEEALPVADYTATDFGASGIGAIGEGQWPTAVDQSWTDAVPQPIPAAPTNWTAEAGKFIDLIHAWLL